jgi:hypothetical protein
MFPPAPAVVANVFLDCEASLTDIGIPTLSDETKHAMPWQTSLPSLNATARYTSFNLFSDRFHVEILACISDMHRFNECNRWYECCHGIGYVDKLIDRVCNLRKLRLQINKDARHFCSPSYRHFQSFTTFGISVGGRSHTINGKRPSPHAAILCREYLDFPAFVLEMRHVIPTVALEKRLWPIYQVRAQANFAMRQKPKTC